MKQERHRETARGWAAGRGREKERERDRERNGGSETKSTWMLLTCCSCVQVTVHMLLEILRIITVYSNLH